MNYPSDMSDDDIEQYEEEIARYDDDPKCPECGQALTAVYDEYGGFDHPRIKGYHCSMCGWWE